MFCAVCGDTTDVGGVCGDVTNSAPFCAACYAACKEAFLACAATRHERHYQADVTHTPLSSAQQDAGLIRDIYVISRQHRRITSVVREADGRLRCNRCQPGGKTYPNPCLHVAHVEKWLRRSSVAVAIGDSPQ